MPFAASFLTNTAKGLILVSFLTALGSEAAPVFLGTITTEGDSSPLLVMAEQKEVLVLTLTSAGAESPELIGDLAATTGSLAAPLFSNQMLRLQRLGEARAGIQRFKFELDIPATERKQHLLLRLRIRPTVAANWLPLPPVEMDVTPRTWPADLRRFARGARSGRVLGSEQLAQVFRRAEVETPEASLEDAAASDIIDVWFCESTGDEFRLPESPKSVWVVFKRNARSGMEITRPTPTAALCLVLDAGILTRLDTDAAAQEIFRRALNTALVLTRRSPDSTQSQP